VARAPNPFASVCGRVCAAPCEDACRRGSVDAPIAIRALKRFVCEQYGVESTRPETQERLHDAPLAEGNRYSAHLPLTWHRRSPQPAPPARGGRQVAVVGAGPAGLAAAHDLALLGYVVTVFDAAEEPGGMMRFGIPEYRLPRTLIRAEIDKSWALGVTFKPNTPLTPSFGLPDLTREPDRRGPAVAERRGHGAWGGGTRVPCARSSARRGSRAARTPSTAFGGSERRRGPAARRRAWTRRGTGHARRRNHRPALGEAAP
jgi:NAD(P)-binding Rossmann-like domain/Dihydroprymidine dehydrogenase domain II, 4Fe-4S cluster